VQGAVELNLTTLVVNKPFEQGKRMFVAALFVCAIASATLAGLLPLQVSIVTVFLFAGPHNWFELRYFITRLPVRFGRSRAFFMTAFIGVASLTIAYISLPLLYRTTGWSYEASLTAIALWNTLLLAWLTTLVFLRSKQKPRSDGAWVIPIAFALCAFNWLAPELFGLMLVYVHPLIALWFLDKHLQRNRPHWVPAYRRSLLLVPLTVGLLVWQLWGTDSLTEDNGLFWRITQHSGAELLPQVSSHLLVSVHLFLEMLHYFVWLLALPLLGPFLIGRKARQNLLARFWELDSLPIARHPRGFPKTVAAMLLVGLAVVLLLWVGFSIDYATTRDVYFTVAIAHVIAEAPFLMKMFQ
jgi:hypothetical protein